jgi:hypothetical protein
MVGGDEVVRLEDSKDVGQRAVELLVLSATVYLAVATWVYLADTSSVAPWQACISVVIAVLLALAALTRNPNRAMTIRFLTGGWLIAAPFVMGFNDVAPALWSYLAIGTLVAAAATPAIVGRLGSRVRAVG